MLSFRIRGVTCNNYHYSQHKNKLKHSMPCVTVSDARAARRHGRIGLERQSPIGCRRMTFQKSKFSDFLYKADPNEPVRTIKASGGAYTGPLHWENRFFTYEEYKRLQTFPDSYQISGSKQIAVKQIGNSVPPQLGRILAIAISSQVFGTPFPFELALLADSEELTFRKHKRVLTDAYRKKAQSAIEALRQKETVLPDSRSYFCSIDQSFAFKEVQRNDARYTVHAVWGAELTITVSEPDFAADPIYIELEIRASKPAKWALAVPLVRLVVCSADDLAFTAAWKAFERELVVNDIKADLVQLNGYYQYVPNFSIKVIACADHKYRSALISVLEQNAVPALRSTHDVALAWGIPDERVIETAEYLKRLGYEIRNHATNPQIDNDYWLIPYAFPTLTNLSVQLWKKLRPERKNDMPQNKYECHLDVYEDRYELHLGEKTEIYHIGLQNQAAQKSFRCRIPMDPGCR